uniref:Uncharacterized protein n=1 Tax=Myoviridae sp. ctxjh1 TaxID=2826714 RepID=A0A8S5R1B5_9CAUD|nr:MAG TPA: hypothetical protein [Myoviridae sp. ctxjh1]
MHRSYNKRGSVILERVTESSHPLFNPIQTRRNV